MKRILQTTLAFVTLSPFFLIAEGREPIGGENIETQQIIEGTQFQYWDQYPKISVPVSAHMVASVSAYGDKFELEDGSIWRVNTYDGHKLKQWQGFISITQNKEWFSPYYYRVINRYNGSFIRTNLVDGPIANGANTYYITLFDQGRGLVTVMKSEDLAAGASDKTVNLEVHPADIATFQSWDMSQTVPVILGDNSDYNDYQNTDYRWECILINVRQSKRYIRVHQY